MPKSSTLLLFLTAAIPIQLGKFFFLSHSYVLGIPVDYRAVSLYLSDLIVAAYLAIFLAENRKSFKKIYVENKKYLFAALALNVYLAVQTAFFSVSKESSFFFNFKIFMFSLLPLIVCQSLQDKQTAKKAIVVLQISLLWQSCLIILQFLNQGALGLWILGERTFDTTTAQIAHTNFLGWQLLRPYGSFPHPNVAAAYMVFSLIMLLGNNRYLLLARRSSLKEVGILLTPIALILTFSKSALFVLTIAVLSAAQNIRRFFIYIIPGAILGVFVLVQLGSQVASVSERLLLIESALDISTKNPLFGVGSNNFILELAKLDLTSLAQTRLLQPVHNVFMLILAENGIVGLLLFALLLLTIARAVQGKIKALLFIALLFYLSVDHFLWTLQQGQLIFWLAIAYILTSKQSFSSNNNRAI